MLPDFLKSKFRPFMERDNETRKPLAPKVFCFHSKICQEFGTMILLGLTDFSGLWEKFEGVVAFKGQNFQSYFHRDYGGRFYKH